MASKAETFRKKKSANGFVVSDHEHEKSKLINMRKNCEKSQVTQKSKTLKPSQQITYDPRKNQDESLRIAKLLKKNRDIS